VNFTEAYKLPIGEHVEKKGKFSYLSWAYAVRFLREHYPQAEWHIHENDAGLPFFCMGESCFVKVSVSVGEQSFTQWHPVLDNNNRPIKEPNAFHINTSIQRCLTKAIGLATGIGLALYAGEDIPREDGDEQKGDQNSGKQLEAFDKLRDAIDSLTLPDAKNSKGQLMTREAFLYWYENIPDVQKLKKLLDAENLSKINSYFQQCLNTFYPMEKAA
jgi:hypothetical protein